MECEEDMRDILDNTSLTRKEVNEARSIVNENEKKGANVAFPGWVLII